MVLSLVISILFLARAVRGNSSQTMAASLFYAGVSFGPPMVYCGVQDQFSPWQFARTFIGSIVSLLTFAAAFVHFLDRYAVKQKREGEDKTECSGKEK
ncbi:hypothetical protein BDV23DRAFT_157223 [Aspergillus alliaceus]|uniref:Major facilitator superfamily domain-containing protein n=1 Tax=Petromyces alliaceus TaxID=209559 RepID=A0A5N7C6Q9_PETAA|nr:hypothetical protein BDV23DRAFT_157223 [Aspergillus alliaceus]